MGQISWPHNVTVLLSLSKISFISDTHNQHDKVPLTEGDILVHCGDFTNRGSLEDVDSFAKFIGKQNFKNKIIIAGNHDFSFEDHRKKEAEKILKDCGIIYLNDSGIEIEGVTFWGSPVQPEFFDWAFNRKRGEEIKKHWDIIPRGTDVLITHGPPSGIMDRCAHGERVGCADLLYIVKESLEDARPWLFWLQKNNFMNHNMELQAERAPPRQ